MTEIKQQITPEQKRERTLATIRMNARDQVTPECRENYLNSCAAHGGEMVELVAIVRAELG